MFPGTPCASSRFMFSLLLGLLMGLLAAVIYGLLAAAAYRTWGATEQEASGAMAGDALVPAPNYLTTLAVTIAAPPEDVWPWLLQMGYRRGGLYSYDWLDRLFGYLDAPSAERILPEWQHLEAGDEVPIGRGGGFPVKVVRPLRALVLGGVAESFRWSWEFGLNPIEPHATRLISRNRGYVPRMPGARLFMLLLEPAAFIMTRKMLLGIKRRAEALADSRCRLARPAA